MKGGAGARLAVIDWLGDAPARRLAEALAAASLTGACGEPPETSFWRSCARLRDHHADSRRAALLDLIERGGTALLPPARIVSSEIFGTAFGPDQAAGRSFGPSVAAPAAAPDGAAIAFAERRWRSDGRLAAKLKIGVFIRADGRLAWEFGVAGPEAPVIARLRAGLRVAAGEAVRRGAVIDLTPSGRQAAWLALRLGGRPADRSAYVAKLRSVGRGEEGWASMAQLPLALPPQAAELTVPR